MTISSTTSTIQIEDESIAIELRVECCSGIELKAIIRFERKSIDDDDEAIIAVVGL